MPNPTADRAGDLYIGRIGLRDDEHEPLLIDWRAPAAHPFYAATPRDPNGLIRRRHIYTRNRTVTGGRRRGLRPGPAVRAGPPEPVRRGHAARRITSRRTGRMSDIVATIQAEQDRVIRSGAAGRAGRAGRPGHRQDRRGAAPRRVPALHPPAHARAPRRAGRRAERHLPPLHQPGAAVARRDRRGARTIGELFPGVKAAARRRPGSRRGQGRRPDGRTCSAAPCATGSGCRRATWRSTADGVDADRADREVVLRARGPGPRAARPHNVARQAVRHRAARRARRPAEARALGARARPRGRRRRAAPGCGTSRRSGAALDSAVAGPHPAAAARRPARPSEGALRRAAPVCPTAERAALLRPGRRRRVDRGGRAAARRGGRAARRRRHRGQAATPGRWTGSAAPRSDTPGRCSRSPRSGTRLGGSTRLADLVDAEHAGRLEPRRGPAAHHGRTGRGRPHLGLRPRDRGRGAGAVRDGLADGHAPMPDPVDDRGRRRGADADRGRRPLLGAGARPVRDGPLARGAVPSTTAPRPRSWRWPPTCWPRSPRASARPSRSARRARRRARSRASPPSPGVVAEELAEMRLTADGWP